jgi:hypothetical protein
VKVCQEIKYLIVENKQSNVRSIYNSNKFLSKRSVIIFRLYPTDDCLRTFIFQASLDLIKITGTPTMFIGASID